MSTEEKIAELVDAWEDLQSMRLWKAKADCESPIEQLLLLSLIAPRSRLPPFRLAVSGDNVRCPRRDEHGIVDLAPRFFVEDDVGPVSRSLRDWQSARYLLLQVTMMIGGARRRLDFAVIGGGTRIVVEADGHDFHERTKEQARKDRSTDRWLQEHGWTVLRFTGSEIYADAGACADQIERAMRQAPRPQPEAR